MGSWLVGGDGWEERLIVCVSIVGVSVEWLLCVVQSTWLVEDGPQVGCLLLKTDWCMVVWLISMAVVIHWAILQIELVWRLDEMCVLCQSIRYICGEGKGKPTFEVKVGRLYQIWINSESNPIGCCQEGGSDLRKSSVKGKPQCWQRGHWEIKMT